MLQATDEREAFHAAIWASPDDDLPRLVYADWLDEHGEHDAAAFLRLLCAVRTCPPDVDKLRPLVADFRRAMVKLPAKWVDDVCPIPPALVVGPWVDVDHPANNAVLEWMQRVRREWKRIQTAEELRPHRPSPPRASDGTFLSCVWEAMLPALTLAAACEIDGVPALVDVWSGVVMAVAGNEDCCDIRKPAAAIGGVTSNSYHPIQFVGGQGWTRLEDAPLGPLGSLDEWIREFGVWEQERIWLAQVVAEFDPANRPG